MNITIEGYMNVGKTEFCNELSSLLYYETSDEISFDDKILDSGIISIIIYNLINDNKSLMETIEKQQIEGSLLLPKYCIFLYSDFINIYHRNKIIQDYFVELRHYNTYMQILNNIKHIYYERSPIQINNNHLYIRNEKEFNLNTINYLNKNVYVDGPPAVGKTTIISKLNHFIVIPEMEYKKYDLKTIYYQFENITNNMNRHLSKSSILDNSFLMNISNLFYANGKNISKSIKLDLVNHLIDNVKDNFMITNVVYLYADIDFLTKNKNNDLTRKRGSFEKNISYISNELDFYTKLRNECFKRFEFKVLIHKRTNDESIDETSLIISKYISLDDNMICLIDILETILSLVKSEDI